jgi:hypothetical protein
MTSPSHGEDRRFNSGRAHFTTKQGRIEPATNNLFGFDEFVGAGSIPAEPTTQIDKAELNQPRTTCLDLTSSLAPVFSCTTGVTLEKEWVKIFQIT